MKFPSPILSCSNENIFFHVGDYSFGFNGQEKEKEVTGEDTHTSAEFWMYDARLGRRWQIDPVIKASLSSYRVLLDNPILFIDPDGSTEFYNWRGRWIGSDGIKNGEKRMAISKATAKAIKKSINEENKVTIESSEFKDIVQIPNEETIKKMEEAWSKTAKTPSIEHTFSVGKDSNGNEISSEIYPGNEKEVNPGPAHTEICSEGGALLYNVHTHPVDLKIDESTGKYNSSSENPSRADVEGSGADQRIFDSQYYNSSNNQDVVIGPQYTVGYDENNKVKAFQEPYISFYTKDSTEVNARIDSDSSNDSMKPNTKMNFEKFTRSARKANKNFSKKNN